MHGPGFFCSEQLKFYEQLKRAAQGKSKSRSGLAEECPSVRPCLSALLLQVQRAGSVMADMAMGIRARGKGPVSNTGGDGIAVAVAAAAGWGQAPAAGGGVEKILFWSGV